MPQYPNSDRFKPRHPIDPFGDDHPRTRSRDPWAIDADNLPPLALSKLQRSVILAIGHIIPQHLLSLLKSQHLASSLLIIATYDHFPLPPFGVACGAVRILRLREPIDIHNNGAERLVRALEWAEMVARVWRVRGGGGVEEHDEPLKSRSRTSSAAGNSRPTSIHDSSESSRAALSSSSVPATPARSSLAPPLSTPPTPSYSVPPSPAPSSHQHRVSKRLSRLARLSSTFTSTPSIPAPNPSQRAFDVLINFLPSNVSPPHIPDSLILKNAVLVTTVSRPYLIPRASPEDTLPYEYKLRGSKSRDFSPASSTSSVDANSTPTSRRRSKSHSSGSGGGGKRWSFFPSSHHPRNQNSSQTMVSTTSTNLSAASSVASFHSVRGASGWGLTPPVPGTLLGSITNTNPSLVIHILPPTASRTPIAQPSTSNTISPSRQKLVRSIEAFLLTFGSTGVSMVATLKPNANGLAPPVAPFARGGEKSPQMNAMGGMTFGSKKLARARPYLVDADAFGGESLSLPEGNVNEEWSLAELLVCGCLDPKFAASVSKEAKKDASGDSVEAPMRWDMHRAWLRTVSDIVVTSTNSGGNTTDSSASSQRSSANGDFGETDPEGYDSGASDATSPTSSPDESEKERTKQLGPSAGGPKRQGTANSSLQDDGLSIRSTSSIMYPESLNGSLHSLAISSYGSSFGSYGYLGNPSYGGYVETPTSPTSSTSTFSPTPIGQGSPIRMAPLTPSKSQPLPTPPSPPVPPKSHMSRGLSYNASQGITSPTKAPRPGTAPISSKLATVTSAPAQDDQHPALKKKFSKWKFWR